MTRTFTGGGLGALVLVLLIACDDGGVEKGTDTATSLDTAFDVEPDAIPSRRSFPQSPAEFAKNADLEEGRKVIQGNELN
jgi:hypothetical protein